MKVLKTKYLVVNRIDCLILVIFIDGRFFCLDEKFFLLFDIIFCLYYVIEFVVSLEEESGE